MILRRFCQIAAVASRPRATWTSLPSTEWQSDSGMLTNAPIARASGFSFLHLTFGGGEDRSVRPGIIVVPAMRPV